LGVRESGEGIGVWSLELTFGVKGLSVRVLDLGLRVKGLGFKV